MPHIQALLQALRFCKSSALAGYSLFYSPFVRSVNNVEKDQERDR